MSDGLRGRWPLPVALAAGVAGTAMLIGWFSWYWPGAHWTVIPRPQLIARARQVAEHFGLETVKWETQSVSEISPSLVEGLQQHPRETQGRAVSPLSLRIKLTKKGGNETAEVGVDSAGLPLSWRSPEEYRPSRRFGSEQDAAEDAFRFFAGNGTVAPGIAPERSMGDDVQDENYIWKLPPAGHSALRERIKVVTKQSIVRRVERQTSFSETGFSRDEQDEDDGGQRAHGSVCTGRARVEGPVALRVIHAIYTLWLVRKAVSHQFPLRMAGAALVLMALTLTAGSAGEKMRFDEDSGAAIATFLIPLAILCIVAVGRGISLDSRRKWMSLEQLCRLAPLSKSTGYSLAAGLLCSPLLLAIPFLIVGCGLFPKSLVMPHQAALLYSRMPLLDSLDIGTDGYLLGFFGFGLPALRRAVRYRWLYWLVALTIGTIFFANQPRLVTGPIAAPLVAGFCALVIYGFLYTYFDLLAVLTLQLASAVLLGALMLAAKGEGSWSLPVATGGLLCFAFWIVRRGQTVTEGDRLASIPALADFRAEREKLKAEFSVARRAQQEMLPQTPPAIPGFSLAASCEPSLEVGGDLYDFFLLPDGRVGFGVADVSGKGVPAALYMTLTKGLLASITKTNAELVSVVEELNGHLHGVTRKKVFVTMALGFLDPSRRVLECVRAGHNPMVWRQASLNKTSLIAPAGLGLGITAARVFGKQLQVAAIGLSPGDAVVFYSDGITEAMNSVLEQFGEERLLESVSKTDHLDAAGARDFIIKDVRAFLDGVHPQDDMTLVVLRAGPADESLPAKQMAEG